MACFVYVSIMDEDRVDAYSLDSETGALDLAHQTPLEGGPAAIAIEPGKRFLYVVLRGASRFASLAVDPRDGSLNLLGTIPEESDSVYATSDATGRFMLTSSNGGARASSYRVGDDGALVAPAACTVHTVRGAHSVQVHPGNRWVYVPHCITQNAIFQYAYDGETGEFALQDLGILVPPTRTGPRHIRFHPGLEVMYTTDEQGNSISAYRVAGDGRLSPPFQTVSTLPPDFDPAGNTTAQLRVHPSGKFLYAPNRGHDTIACFAIDPASGKLTLIGRAATEPHVRGFDVDPQGKFVFAAGVDSGRMSAYGIDRGSGMLTFLHSCEVGEKPMWVLTAEL